MRFAYPIWLILLIFIPLYSWLFFTKKRFSFPNIRFSDIRGIKKIHPKIFLHPRLLSGARLISLVLLILGMARPQSGQKSEEVLNRGLDIIVCLDTSTSMRAEDFKPKNRLDAAKAAAKKFIQGRKNDRIGLVVFSALSFTQCPLTLDYGAVLDFLDKVEIGMTQTDGTAIGMAIGTCLNRLKDSSAKSKVVILLTDGRNNKGEIDPVTAAKAAQALGIKIYTIGAGAPGGSLFPYEDPIFGRRYVQLPEDLDEETLTGIAQITGGLYFRATDSQSLNNIYKQIDKMEKTEIKVKEYTEYIELYPFFIFPGLILLLLEIILGNTYFRRIP
ncbi:MAG: VWA domain-containing protein [Elusimicrobiota bacterium]